MRPHSLDQLRDREVFFSFRVIGRLAEVCGRKTLQQSQVRMAIQSVERDHLGGRGLHVAQVPRPFVLVHGRNHRLLVGEHLAKPVGVHDLDVCEVTKNLQDAPLVRRRLVAQNLIRQA